MAYRRFVEDDEMFVDGEQPSRPWMDAKETAKLMAWNRQELISNELSRLAADEYLEDIMQHLRHMEVRFFLLSGQRLPWPLGRPFRYPALDNRVVCHLNALG